MGGTTDNDLIHRFARLGDEEAFRELVERHCNLVWATACRVSGNGEAARDITQTVFCLLARKARRLPPATILAGWLHRAAHLEAMKHLRQEVRRNARESDAMNRLDSNPDGLGLDSATAALQPLLDEALAELGDEDRDAVILRYLTGRGLAEIGTTMGSSEDAAQKRVSRALEKLRTWFRIRGISVGDGVMVAALGVASANAAPTGLAFTVSGAALAGGGAVAALLSGILLMNTKIVTGTLAALAVASLAWQQTRIGHLMRENSDLKRQAIAASLAPSPVAAMTVSGDDAHLREDHAELLRLRGEVARRRQTASESVLRSIADAEERAQRAEEQAEAIRNEVAFRQRRQQLVQTGMNLGLAARIFSTDHQDRVPSTLDEMRDEMKNTGVDEEGQNASTIYEFFTHPRPPSLGEPQLILFREREARRIPQAALNAADISTGTPFAIPLQQGWERLYILIDGSVQTISNVDGDFSEFERMGTAAGAATGESGTGNP